MDSPNSVISFERSQCRPYRSLPTGIIRYKKQWRRARRSRMFGASDDQVKSTRELSVRELNAMIPRKVSLNPDGGYAIVVFIMIFLGIGAAWFGALSYTTIQKSRHRDALNKDGREAMAKVIELTNNRAIHVRYTFRSGGADYEGVAE